MPSKPASFASCRHSTSVIWSRIRKGPEVDRLLHVEPPGRPASRVGSSRLLHRPDRLERKRRYPRGRRGTFQGATTGDAGVGCVYRMSGWSGRGGGLGRPRFRGIHGGHSSGRGQPCKSSPGRFLGAQLRSRRSPPLAFIKATTLASSTSMPRPGPSGTRNVPVSTRSGSTRTSAVRNWGPFRAAGFCNP